MIVYHTELNETHYELGTSGFLYRSNKLMYDLETKSLWNTLRGEPVIGPLVGKGIRLKRSSVVTTNWGQWKQDHPDTTVLSLDTGHDRDYGEGVAYKSYFASDELMFDVPTTDPRLRNKAEVVALVFEESPDEQLAVSLSFLMENRIYQGRLGQQDFVILTDSSGANRVFQSGAQKFIRMDGDDSVVDEQGVKWKIGELELKSQSGETLVRLPSHRAFWFGWRSTFPDTQLVK